jgi:hypothetical protein
VAAISSYRDSNAVAPAPAPAPVLTRPARALLLAQLRTTPGRLRLIGAAIVAAAVVLGLIAWGAERSRDHAARAVKTQTEPLLAEATSLYASLSDADATITTTFINGGIEPSARRARYLSDLATASTELSRLAHQVQGSARATTAVATVTARLPIYTGDVEAARTDNRQRLPVGAAYLRQASELLRTEILPAAGDLFSVEAARLGEDYATGTDDAALALFAIGMAALLGIIVAAQVYLARTTNRTLNVPGAAAAGLVAILAVWGTVGLLSEQSSLSTARKNGSDAVEVLAATRILTLRAQRDESLALVARDGGESADLAAVTRVLAPGSGALVAEDGRIARRTGTIDQQRSLSNELAAYLAAHDRVASLEATGRFANALAAAPAEAALSTRLDTDLQTQIGAAQRRFTSSAGSATSDLSGLGLATALMVAAAAALVLIGLRPRINEYR